MKVGIVGAGMVGSSAGYALAVMGLASTVVLVDQNHDLAVAQAEDIAHAVPFMSSTIVEATDYDGLLGAAVVILAAGVSQKPGETRLALLERNAAVFKDVVGKVLKVAADCVEPGRYHDADYPAYFRPSDQSRDRVWHHP